ncbi:MAG: hypothetical protein WBM98_03165 [Maribacter sp.]|uniref:hypothetical protein n=1 Tax=Maribacter sp. TaxID=1897614 RepID=UPI003C79163A
MKRLLKIVLVSSLSLCCFSCYYDELPEEQDLVVEIPDDVVVSFNDDVQPIFSQCTGCHNGNTSPDLREGNAFNAIVPQYVSAGDAENSEFYKKLPGNDHPVEAGLVLTSDEIGIIKAWIDRGAENN